MKRVLSLDRDESRLVNELMTDAAINRPSLADIIDSRPPFCSNPALKLMKAINGIRGSKFTIAAEKRAFGCDVQSSVCVTWSHELLLTADYSIVT
jgi:hypothetical protein